MSERPSARRRVGGEPARIRGVDDGVQRLQPPAAAEPKDYKLTEEKVLAEIRAETDNWRFRHLLSSQLGAFGAAFSRSAVQETLLPLALSLCTDSVAEVRLAAIAQVGLLVELLLEDAPLDCPQPLLDLATNRLGHLRA